jgi:Glyoxalase superfamily protein
MRTYLDAKLMARALRSAFEKQHIAISHNQALEVVATQFECPDWNVLAAKIQAARAPSTFEQVSPILRIFDEGKAKEFYLDFLGFHLDWEHRFGEKFPLYAQVSRAGLILSSERTSWRRKPRVEYFRLHARGAGISERIV